MNSLSIGRLVVKNFSKVSNTLYFENVSKRFKWIFLLVNSSGTVVVKQPKVVTAHDENCSSKFVDRNVVQDCIEIEASC